MNRRRFTRQLWLAIMSAMPVLALAAPLAPAPAASSNRKPDLADAAAGTYAGDVISDSQGSSQSGVTLTITRISANRIRISSDYPRLPVVDVPLTSAMGKIIQGGGDTAFVLDARHARLDVSFRNEVSWAGKRR
jgi:hypothetical protein